MSNVGLEKTLSDAGIQMHRAKVGDRHVVEMMKKEGLILGGEQSGHIIFLDSSTTGDGILAALKILEIMKRTGKKLSELRKQIPLYPQARADLTVSERVPLADLPLVQAEMDAAEKALGTRGRVFVRYSGTEPLVRVLVEGENLAQIQDFANRIAIALDVSLNEGTSGIDAGITKKPVKTTRKAKAGATKGKRR
jgi:phosphoglucosamine mutase